MLGVAVLHVQASVWTYSVQFLWVNAKEHSSWTVWCENLQSIKAPESGRVLLLPRQCGQSSCCFTPVRLVLSAFWIFTILVDVQWFLIF